MSNHHPIRWILSAILVLGFLLSACAAPYVPEDATPAAPDAVGEGTQDEPVTDEEEEKSLTYLLVQEPNSMDPHVITESQSGLPIRNVYERLVELSSEGLTLEPGLAETWDISEDGLTYTFNLREDVNFHSGTPFTAEAVRYSFDRALSMGQGDSFPLSEYLTPENVEVIDDHTVQFTLDQPYGPFLSLLAQYNIGSIVNPEVVEANATEEDPWAQEYLATNMDGTGPFRFVEWQPKQFVALERSEDYWRGPAALGQIIFQLVEEPATARLMLERGEADIVHNLPTDMIDALRENSEIEISEQPGLETTYWAFNAQTEPFDDERVRRALALAVDYESIMENIVQEGGIRMIGPIPQGLPGYDADLPVIERDLERARELLAEAGYPDGFSVATHYPVWRNLADIAVVLQSNMADIGVDLELQEVTLGGLVELVVSGETPFFSWVSTPGWADPDAVMFLKFYTENVEYGAAGNISAYSNPEVDTLLEAAQATTDQQERIELYQEIQEIVVEDTPWIFLYQSVIQQPMRAAVENYEFPVIGVPSFWAVDIIE